MFFESFWLNCTVAVGLIIALTFDYVTKFFSYWYVRHIPYKTSIPFFGSDYHRVLGIRNTTEEVNSLYKQHPKEDFVGSVKSRIPDLIVRNPDLIKEVLCTEFESFKSRGLDLDKSQDICIRNNLFYTEGEKWTLLRERLDSLLNDVTTSEECILESLSGTNGNINVQHLLTKILDDVFKTTFLENSNDSVIKDLRTVFHSRGLLNKYYNYLKNIFPSVYVFFGLLTLSRPSRKHIEAISQSLLYKKIESLFDFNNKNVQRMLHSKQKDFTFQILSSLISEGYIPTLNLLTALIYEIAKNPQVQIQSRDCSEEYLDAIIKEALRLHPPISVITRKCVKTYKFSQSKVLIDRGITVNIPVEAIHTDEMFYDEPTMFKPERFMNDAPIQSYTFLPFSAGPRKCIGEQFSLQLARSITKAIVKRYKIEPTDRTPEKLTTTDYNFKRVVDGDVWLRFTPL